jgi:hypothetical protein
VSRFARRVDGNHVEIVTALRAEGAFVQSLAGVGVGVPDLLVGVRGRWLLVEVKDGSKISSAQALTPDQVTWHAAVTSRGLPVCVVRSVTEALALL